MLLSLMTLCNVQPNILKNQVLNEEVLAYCYNLTQRLLK